MPTRLIDSTPPPIVISCWPDITSRRGEVHRVEAGGAETIDLHARHAVAETGDQRGRARDVAARLADRIDAAEHHVVDKRGVELVAILDRGERLRREIERGHLVQRSVGLAAPARACGRRRR